jgi:hypothetical protein
MKATSIVALGIWSIMTSQRSMTRPMPSMMSALSPVLLGVRPSIALCRYIDVSRHTTSPMTTMRPKLVAFIQTWKSRCASSQYHNVQLFYFADKVLLFLPARWLTDSRPPDQWAPSALGSLEGFRWLKRVCVTICRQREEWRGIASGVFYLFGKLMSLISFWRSFSPFLSLLILDTFVWCTNYFLNLSWL